MGRGGGDGGRGKEGRGRVEDCWTSDKFMYCIFRLTMWLQYIFCQLWSACTLQGIESLLAGASVATLDVYICRRASGLAQFCLVFLCRLVA